MAKSKVSKPTKKQKTPTDKLSMESKIEYQEQIGDVKEGGYQPIRFSKVKYKNNSQLFIDIRVYQRGYDNEGEEVFYPTRRGFQFEEWYFKRIIEKYALLPSTYVHRDIIKKSFDLLNSGHYESAVLQAFKIIETKIRKKIGATHEDFGIALIRKAFNSETGILTDLSLPKSEREAFSNYIAGAFGYYKNPCSHRDLDIDYIEAFDRIVVASDLLKVIDKAKKNRPKEGLKPKG